MEKPPINQALVNQHGGAQDPGSPTLQGGRIKTAHFAKDIRTHVALDIPGGFLQQIAVPAHLTKRRIYCAHRVLDGGILTQVHSRGILEAFYKGAKVFDYPVEYDQSPYLQFCVRFDYVNGTGVMTSGAGDFLYVGASHTGQPMPIAPFPVELTCDTLRYSSNLLFNSEAHVLSALVLACVSEGDELIQ